MPTTDQDAAPAHPLKRIPYSALSLLIPALAYAGIDATAASTSEKLGYAVSQLGYVMLIGGVIWGTFRVFRLHRRSTVVATAVLIWIVGVVLTNT